MRLCQLCARLHCWPVNTSVGGSDDVAACCLRMPSAPLAIWRWLLRRSAFGALWHEEFATEAQSGMELTVRPRCSRPTLLGFVI